MKGITTTHKISFGATILLVCMVVGYVFFYRHIHTLQEELREINREIALMDALAANKQATIELLSDTEEERIMLGERLIPSDPTPFLNLIEAVARDAGIASVDSPTDVVESLDISNVDEEGYVKKNANVVLNIQGEWDDLYHFLKLLEHFPYITTISKATFAQKETPGGTWEGQVHLRCATK